MISCCIKEHRQASADIDELVNYTLEKYCSCCCFQGSNNPVSFMDMARRGTMSLLATETISTCFSGCILPNTYLPLITTGISVTIAAIGAIELSTCMVCIGNICMRIIKPEQQPQIQAIRLLPWNHHGNYESLNDLSVISVQATPYQPL